MLTDVAECEEGGGYERKYVARSARNMDLFVPAGSAYPSPQNLPSLNQALIC